MVGGEARIYFELRDVKDHYLQGIGGVTYALVGAITEDQLSLVDAIAEAIVNVLTGSNNESLAIEALDVGSGEIVVSAPGGASRTLPVRVVDAAAITRVDVWREDEPPRVGTPYSVHAEAFAGDEPVHAPTCAWTLDPEGALGLSASGAVATLQAAAPAEATVTCTIGSASAGLLVDFRP